MVMLLIYLIGCIIAYALSRYFGKKLIILEYSDPEIREGDLEILDSLSLLMGIYYWIAVIFIILIRLLVYKK